MASIGIIINPHSKKIKRMKDPVGFYQKIGREIVDIKLTENLNDISKAAADFKKQNIKYLVISGGDGSIHHVISSFKAIYKTKELPAILILKDGSMNNIAKSYNLKGNGNYLLSRLITHIEKNIPVNYVYRNTIKINNMYCFLFGLGFVANYINEFNKGGNKSPYKAIKVLLKTILNIIKGCDDNLLKKAHMTVSVDGKDLWFKDFVAIFASTIANLAIGFNPTPRAYEKENAFHLLATGMKPAEMLFRINKIRKGKAIKHPLHYDNIASNIKIISSDDFLYQMDGDIYKSDGNLLVETGPRIKFVSF